MIRWEYMVAVGGYNKSDQFKVQFVNGKEVPGWTTGPSTHEYLTRWGAEGWEALSYMENAWQTEVSGVSRVQFRGDFHVSEVQKPWLRFTIILKRPK